MNRFPPWKPNSNSAGVYHRWCITQIIPVQALVVGGVEEVVLSVLAGDVDQPVLRDDAPAGGLAVVRRAALVAGLVLRTAARGVEVRAGVLRTPCTATPTSQSTQ